MVVELIRGRSVYSGSPLGSLGSFWFLEYTQVRPGCRSPGVVGFTSSRRGGCWVHPWSSASLMHAVGVDGFNLGSFVRSHLPWGSLGSSGVIRFTFARPGSRWGHWIHSREPQGLLGSSRVVVLTLQRPWVYPRSLGLLASSLRVFRFILRRWVH